MAAKKQALQIDGKQVSVSNLDKILYRDAHFSKAQVIEYYIRIADYLLPHFRDRPVTLKRFPDGVGGEFFYEKDAPGFAPEWIHTYPVPRRAGGPDIKYILINDLATLVWCANAASLELHPFLHTSPHLNQPTHLVFDLDPGEGADLLTCAEVAFLLKGVLEGLDLQSWAKVSGSKGLQVYVPLNSQVSYDVAQPFASALAMLMAKQHPKLITAEMAKYQRGGKVFIDWSQNSDFKTTIGVYSLRAKVGRPFVSLPVTWNELDSAIKRKSKEGLYWHAAAAIERVRKVGDLFAPVLSVRQKLPEYAAPEEFNAGPLREYQRKRNFSRTEEPSGETDRAPRASAQGGRKRFVIQKHAASHLHYDFRLEMHGVLKSWAVPKGVPYSIGEKRLAMATEDHPIEYLDFEGIIPEGQYGGGTVMVWDIGTYEVIEGSYYKGQLRIFLEGRKLKGEWQLVRDRGKSKNWFLIKAGNVMRRLSGKREDSSALSGRSLAEIAGDKSAQWHSNRTPVPGIDLDRLPRSPMKFVEPMQCKLVVDLPEGSDWQYEVKLDGYRTLAIKTAGRVSLLSRRNNLLNERFSAIVEALKNAEEGLILDGEVVAMDEQGRPSFHLLQNHRTQKVHLVYFVFDLLAYRERDCTGLTLNERRRLLESVSMRFGDEVRVSALLNAEARTVIDAIRRQGLEGVIGKRADSIYVPGDRRGAWVKYKVNRGQELVIGGYKPGKDHFENLAVGYYEGDRLLFVGKIKNGFTPAMKDEVSGRFGGLGTDTCPFDNLPEPKNARRGEALTAEAMKKYCWLRPELVAQVEFTDWTEANHLRHSKFVSLRDDKDPRSVVHEIPAETETPRRAAG